MSPILKNLGIDRLSPEERLKLIGEIWDSLSPSDQTEIPEEHREQVDQRLDWADANPGKGSSWEEVRARILKQRSCALP
jgi:putative addiction module component (TIGR02574 family)